MILRNPLISLLTGILFLILIIVFLLKRARNNWIRNYQTEVLDCLNKIILFVLNFNSMTSFERGYFSNYDLTEWKNGADSLIQFIESVPNLKRYITHESLFIIREFKELYKACDVSRKGYNEQFIENELEEKQDYFSTILSRSLDEEQRRAIIIDEDCNLIIAGAGCGKTTTIEGKTKYIIDRYNVNPEEILLISFTKKSSEEMAERVNHQLGLKVKVQTFHSLGLEIIGRATNEKPSVLEENNVMSIINKSFSDQRKDINYLTKLNEFFLSYLKIPPNEEKLTDEDGLRLYLKNNDIVSLNEIKVSYNGKTTLERQFCRSYEEVLIANFLLLNQVEYLYEPSYQENTATAEYRQYKPDFYLPQYGIYIEHYGIDEKGNVPKWFGNLASGEFSQNKYNEQNKKYKEKMMWADEIHAKYRTTLIKTYSWENKKGTLLTDLETKLRQMNVQFKPLDPKQVWATIVQSAEKDVTDFELLIRTFLTLLKSNHRTIEEVKNKIKTIGNDFQQKRASIFIELFTPIYEAYESALHEKKEVDFNDMINKASYYVKEGKYERRIKYLIIDEFQDISFGRYKLIKAILDYNFGCKLFCVGDDWQSIFRFTGSDIALFTEFDKHFGVTYRSQITTTYRFNNEIISATSNFIQQNPNQVKKQLKSKSIYSASGLQIISTGAPRYDKDISPIKIAFDQILKDIENRREDVSKVKVMVLGRYNHDRKVFEDNKQFFVLNENKITQTFTITYQQSPTLKVHFMTMHGAKGLEADYVILLNCNSGKYGIPSERSDDPILNLLLSNADQFENGEERRLFYVALTRTKRKVFIVTSDKNRSKFVNELAQYIKSSPPPRPDWDDLPF